VGAALVWAALPLLVALCEARPRALDACHAPGTPLAIEACRDGPRELDGAARLLFGAGLDPNRATAAELALLPGVGPVRAAAIVAARRREPFERPEDLQRVHGIGPRTVEKLRAWVQIDPSAADR
jgi:competence ComEA-like helix-hairpin-helix protein